jgi:cytidine deaminase
MSLNTSDIYKIRDELIKKRREQNLGSGYHSPMNSNHMCAILDHSGVPISFGTNVFNIKTTEHAEAQAFRKLLERMGKTSKKLKIDVLVIRTNGHNSKPCDRCIRRMEELKTRFNIRNIYYTHEKEPDGIRCVKFCKLVQEPERHFSSFDRNLRRPHSPNNSPNNMCKVC